MYVRELPPDRGMLFLFERPQPLAFWMKDTYLSLDLIFIDPAGRVLNIAAHARPLSLEPIRSDGDAIAVLEVLAGTARTIGLQPGDRLNLPTLRTTGTPSPSPARRNRPWTTRAEVVLADLGRVRRPVGAELPTLRK